MSDLEVFEELLTEARARGTAWREAVEAGKSLAWRAWLYREAYSLYQCAYNATLNKAMAREIRSEAVSLFATWHSVGGPVYPMVSDYVKAYGIEG